MAYRDPAANIEKIRQSRREWYYHNKDRQRLAKNRRDVELKKWLRNQKTKCERCPETHVAALQFHHVDPSQKEITLARAIANGWSIARMESEVAKCEVLCANCHAKEHYAG